MSPSSSTTRWCPTQDQVMILKELYRRGLRNPNASQIQKIATHLSFFGEIQSKNVFYWFQNRKARDRQKLRKKLAKQMHQHQHQPTSFALHQLFDYYAAQNLYLQGIGACEGTWTADLSSELLIRTYGHDPMMITEVVPPMFSCCSNRPLETLELFPLTSPTLEDKKTTVV